MANSQKSRRAVREQSPADAVIPLVALAVLVAGSIVTFGLSKE